MARITYEEFKQNGGRAILCRNPENVEEEHGKNEDLWPVEYSATNLKEFLDHEDLGQQFMEFCHVNDRRDLWNLYDLTPDLLELNNEELIEFSMDLNELTDPLYGVIYHAD